MKLFLDTASIDEIREINRWGVLGGVTTNPSLLEKESSDPQKVWRQILDEVHGDVSLEVTAPDADGMVDQGTKLAAMGSNAVVKVPMTPDGLEAGTRLVARGIRINVTLVFSPAPFLGRVDDVASDGMAVLRSICDIYAVQGYGTKVLAASLRHPMHVVESALAGADIATMPYDVFTKLVKHPLTDLGMERFQADWQKLQRLLEGEAST